MEVRLVLMFSCSNVLMFNRTKSHFAFQVGSRITVIFFSRSGIAAGLIGLAAALASLAGKNLTRQALIAGGAGWIAVKTAVGANII